MRLIHSAGHALEVLPVFVDVSHLKGLRGFFERLKIARVATRSRVWISQHLNNTCAENVSTKTAQPGKTRSVSKGKPPVMKQAFKNFASYF